MPQQDHLTARLVVDDDFEVAPVNNRLFGSFVEHLGRCVYTGIYEPDHPTADEHGFRKDVIDLVKELGATTIRYPGGNFVSGYRWDVELVVCGSSAHGMPTFGKWEQTVLEKTYENVNFVSCHAYYQPFFKEDGTRDMASFLASGVDMDGFIKDVAATIDATKAHLKSAHDVYISFDEWNVWYQGEEPSKTPEGIGNWPVAPRLLEDIYTAADAVVFGDLMITLLKNADRVRAASLAQLVNVIAPIMTEPGGPAWRQTTFHPFSVTARLAKGGTVLEPKLSAGTVDTPRYGEVDGVNAVAVRCADGSLAVFAVNRSLEATAEFEIRLQDGAQPASVEAQTLHDDDLFAANTLYDQNRVTPHANGSAMYDAESGVVRVSLPPVSWTALHIK